MCAKTYAISIKKSANCLSKREKNIITNQVHNKNGLSHRQNTVASPCHIDRYDCGNEKIEIEENWADTVIDEELEIADIYESDFHFFNHKLE
ncbi:MAG: hypothetical protein E6Q62_06160 [Nitrosomonas sp.]|nr:MAG: hypothetical protein E6Q62_06160 [Nitrosomonas sp.]